MSDPVIPQKAPYTVDLEPGTYFWCACGRSATQPACDGSHRGSEWTPVRYEVTEAKKVWFCGCKHTQKAPLCDGSHNRL
jgi:CDGSH-type Zn-finger protein